MRGKVLMCGWRRDIRDMVMLLDSLLLSGSELHLLSEVTVKDRYKEVRVEGVYTFYVILRYSLIKDRYKEVRSPLSRASL